MCTRLHVLSTHVTFYSSLHQSEQCRRRVHLRTFGSVWDADATALQFSLIYLLNALERPAAPSELLVKRMRPPRADGGAK